MEGLLEMVAQIDQFLPLVDALTPKAAEVLTKLGDVLALTGPALFERTGGWIIERRIHHINRLEEAGFTREEAIVDHHG